MSKKRHNFISKFHYKVCRSHVFQDSLWYIIQCDCGDSRHSLQMEMEVDKDGILWLHFYADTEYAYYGDNIIKRIWHRIKGALRLIFIGYIELQEEMVILDKEHIDNFIDALVESRNFLSMKREYDRRSN